MNWTGWPRRARPTATLSGLPPTWASISDVRWTTSTRPSPITVSMHLLCQRTRRAAPVVHKTAVHTTTSAHTKAAQRNLSARYAALFKRLAPSRLCLLLAGQRELEDLAPRGAHLLEQRTRGVRQSVALADFLHLRRHLAVPVGREVGEEVVLDLVGQVPGHEVHELGA